MTSKIAGKVMVSGGILRGGTIIRECNTKKNVTDISQRQTTKKTIQESKIFREDTKNRSHALKQNSHFLKKQNKINLVAST